MTPFFALSPKIQPENHVITKITPQTHSRAAYSAYKPSGIESLREIPKHWSYASLRWISQRYAGGTPDRNNLDFWINGTIPWVNSGTVNQALIKTPSAFITESALRGSSAKWVPKGALLMALAGQGKTKGMVAQTGIRTTCNQSLAAICPDEVVESRFLLQWLQSQYGNIRGLAGDEQRDGLNLEMIGSIPCPLPPLDEQRAIAAFLDRETARVDALIEKKQRQVELLQEKRTALISRAVTKGLDPNARMKDSGIEWLGEILTHWNTLGCKFAYSIQLGKMLQNEPQSPTDVKVPYLKALNVRWETVDTADLAEMWASPSDLKNYSVEDGDLLVCEGGEVGRAGILADVPDSCIIQNALHRVRAKGRNNTKYLMYLLEVAGSNKWIEILCNKATIAHFTGEKFGEFAIVLPLPAEQRAIAAFLDRETARIDALIEKVEASIDLLREYRTALISAAVTGKIDVRKEAA